MMRFFSNRIPSLFYQNFFAAFLLLALTSTAVSAQEEDAAPPIDIDAKVDKTGVTTGDSLTFTVSIVADPDIKPHPPNFNSHFTGFEIIDNGVRKPVKEGKQLRTEIWYRLRADETGEFIIPPVAVTFSAPDPKYPDKSVQGQILTPEVKINVLSVLRTQGEPKDIRDIKPILEMEPDWRQYVLYALLLILALTLLFVWADKNKRPRKRKTKPEPPPLLPHELAFRELKALRSRELLQKGKFREHYFELSEIFRRYLGNRFRFPALDWTTEEITAWMENSRLLQDSTRVRMWDILDNSDQVKYAKAQPSIYVSEKTMESIDRFIQETMEQPRPEEPQRQGAI